MATDWQNTRVTIMGLGSFGGGVGLARYLATHGARITVTDRQPADALRASLEALRDFPIRFVLGEHRNRDFIDTDVVFVNPAVPLTSPYLELARAHHIRLDSEINLFVRRCPGRIIGITGSVGKSTTTALLGSILSQHDPRTLVGGNFGGSLLSSLPQIGTDTPVILELSSFQLEHLAWQQYSPPLAVVLNLVPNHLDRHGTMAAYQQAKEHILAYQQPTDTAILNWDDATVRRMACRSRGRHLYYSLHHKVGATPEATLPNRVYCQDTRLILTTEGSEVVLCQRSDVSLRGAHNLSNAAAAVAAAGILGVPPTTIAQGLQRFRGLPHRLEWVATKGGVEYYNDSKATTPLSTMRALQAFDQPVILLAGGYDKGTPFDDLGQVIRYRTKAVLVYGKTAAKLAQAIAEAVRTSPEPPTPLVLQLPDLTTAFARSVSLAEPGDSVVLSPACASYDQFPHFAARGDSFRHLVRALL